MEKDCLFCKIIANEIPCYKIYEDDSWLAFLDINPINLGHTLIIPKIHKDDLFGLDEKTLRSVGSILQRIALAIKTGVGADGINIGMNNGKEAGQLIPHAHIHVIPRFASDGFESWHGKNDYQPEDFKQTLKKISKEKF